jgi:hypothetical protein
MYDDTKDSNTQGGDQATTLSHLGEIALHHAASGISVFLCEPGGKVPLFFQGAAEATTDEAKIRSWWTANPTANIGGVLHKRVVIDVSHDAEDLGEDSAELAQRLSQEPTCTHLSPRQAHHFIFTTEGEKQFADKAELALGIRIHTQWVLLPESVITKTQMQDGVPVTEELGRYETVNPAPAAPLPEWLAERLRCAEAPKRRDEDPMSHEDWLREPEVPMVVSKMVPDLRPMFVWGVTGNGKTYAIAELAAAIAWRLPAFGKFPVNLPGSGGVVVIFAAEDTRELVLSRLTALAIKHNRSIEGRIFVSQVALPVDDPGLQDHLRRKLREIQERAGLKIDAIFNDTTGRSLGMLSPRDEEVAHAYTKMCEKLCKEFRCPTISTIHAPASGERLAGSQVFENNVAVVMSVEGRKRDGRLQSMRISFDKKYRIGAPPPPFWAVPEAIRLPKPVNENETDLVFSFTDKDPCGSGAGEEPEQRKLKPGEVNREKILTALHSFGGDGATYSAWKQRAEERGINSKTFEKWPARLTAPGPGFGIDVVERADGTKVYYKLSRTIGELGGDRPVADNCRTLQ